MPFTNIKCKKMPKISNTARSDRLTLSCNRVYVTRDSWEGRGEVWVSLCDSFQVAVCFMHAILASSTYQWLVQFFFGIEKLIPVLMRNAVVATHTDSKAKVVMAFAGIPIVITFKVALLRPRYVEMDLAVPNPEPAEEQRRVVNDNYVFQHPALDTTKSPFYQCCYTKYQLEDIQPFYKNLARPLINK